MACKYRDPYNFRCVYAFVFANPMSVQVLSGLGRGGGKYGTSSRKCRHESVSYYTWKRAPPYVVNRVEKLPLWLTSAGCRCPNKKNLEIESY